MEEILIALMLAVPVVAHAMDTESTPQVNPQNVDFVAGKKAVADKNWQAAVDAFSRAAKSDSRNADIHDYLGYSNRHLDRMELSFKHYNEALRLEPNHLGANEYIGWAYLKTHQLPKAEEHLARLQKRCGTSCEAYQNLGRGIAEYKTKNKS